jgi:hypothetical protein
LWLLPPLGRRPAAGGSLRAGRRVQGSEHIAVYASSDWAQRAFCRECGTHLYYKLLATGEYFVPAGTLDSTDFRLASQIYIDKKPPYYAFANQTPTLTEQQVIERYGPPSGATHGA